MTSGNVRNLTTDGVLMYLTSAAGSGALSASTGVTIPCNGWCSAGSGGRSVS